MTKITLSKSDITTLDVDAVVNAANNNLLRGGGLCGAIFDAAGSELEGACRDLKYCETGSAVCTPGFKLKARYIIHAVGPRYFLNPEDSPALLANAYKNTLKEAARVRAKSIALPCLSTGIYGYPLFPAAKVAVKTVQSEVPHYDFSDVIFCCHEEESYLIYKRLLNWSES